MQLDLNAALEARDRSMAQVDENAAEDWKVRAAAAWRSACTEREYLLCDDLWEYIERPREPRASGPVIRRAARDGICERAGWATSAQPQCHGNPRTRWRSLIYTGGAP